MGLFQSRNPSSSTEVKAFEACHGIGKPQHFFNLPILEEAVNEPSMEDISCAGGIESLYIEPCGVEDFSVDPGHGTRVTQGGAEESRNLFLKLKESLFAI